MQPLPIDNSPLPGGGAGLRELLFRPAGDTALDIFLGDRMDRPLSDAVLAMAMRIEAAQMPGVVEAVPAFASLTVHYDPLVVSYEVLTTRVRSLGHVPAASTPPRRWRVPVCYEGTAAPDLDHVAARVGLTRAEVIARHGAQSYHVYMLGFLPGFPYMGDLPTELRLPRRGSPRVAVPAGSVAIANAMTAVYPLKSPGGWHIIGVTPVQLFDPSRRSPSLFAPGDVVCFEAVTAFELGRLEYFAVRGQWSLQPEPLDRARTP